MDSILMTVEVTDNGGRRRIHDRRFLISAPFANDQRTNWERRSGYDRRLRRILDHSEDRRVAELKCRKMV